MTGSGQSSTDEPVASTTPEELKDRIDNEEVFLLDMRSEEDFEE